MKKLSLTLMAILLSAVLVACGESDIERGEVSQNVTSEKTANENTVDEKSVEEEKEEEVKVGTRTNPIKPNEPVIISTIVSDYEKDLRADAEFEIVVSNFIRGQEAYDILLAENQFNEPAPEGYEWLLFDVSLTANIEDDNLSYYIMPSFNPFTLDGSPITVDDFAVTPNEFGHTDVYNGGTVTGKVSTLAPVGEDVLIEYSSFDFNFFFTTKED